MSKYTTHLTEKTKGVSLIVLAITLMIGIGASQQANREVNLSNEGNCYQEGDIWNCYQPTFIENVQLNFTENIKCYLESNKSCEGNCNELATSCYSKVKPKKDIEIKIDIKKIKSYEEWEEVTKNVTLDPDKKFNAIIDAKEINFNKCGETYSPSLFTYAVNCSYKGKEVTANVSYIKSGLIISGIGKPKEKEIQLPQIGLVELILIIIVIFTAIWVLYPKIRKRGKKKK